VDLAKLYYERNDWTNSLETAKEALAIVEKPLEYLCEAEAWGAAPYDYAAIACYNLGMYKEASEYAQQAYDLEPSNERLKNNLDFCLMKSDLVKKKGKK
jgi:tetratricopeptide (TPR) repeat protein